MSDQPTVNPAYRQIWRIVSLIPAGHVASYGAVADMAELPRRARLVSKALKEAPKAMNLPWFRVVNAQGRIAFPDDSEAYQRQRQLLEEEGVVFIRGKIDLKHYAWRISLDELLWAPTHND